MRLSVLVTLFLVLTTVFSVYAVAYGQALPASQTETRVDATYLLNGTYGYVATLKPNILYGTTVVRNGNGSLFVSITKLINVTFTCALTTSRPADAALDSTYTTTLSGGVWSRVLARASNDARMSNTNNVVISKSFLLNVTLIQDLIRNLESELKYTAPEYSVQIKPVVTGSLSVSGEAVNLKFFAPLYLRMANGVISVNGTGHSQAGNITSIATRDNPNTIRFRTMLYVALLSSSVGLAGSGAFTLRSGRRKKLVSRAKELEMTTRPYREIISVTRSPPEGGKRVVVESWGDLVKVADTLGKPILEFVGKKPRGGSLHLFYAFDGDVYYIYEFEPRTW